MTNDGLYVDRVHTLAQANFIYEYECVLKNVHVLLLSFVTISLSYKGSGWLYKGVHVRRNCLSGWCYQLVLVEKTNEISFEMKDTLNVVAARMKHMTF